MSQRDLWPSLLPRSEADLAATEVQWLRNLTVDELVSHAQLHGCTPLERVLAKVLAVHVDGDSAECERLRQELEELQGRDVFEPAWPPGLKHDEAHRLPCDDKGRNGGSWLQVMVANDGDVHLLMQDWEDPSEGIPNPIPGLRCRTFQGGGRHGRTHQALLWLAQAIRLDREELAKR